jgi:hypothetical protein
MKKCSFCAEQIQDDAIICRFCNRDLNIEVNTSPCSSNHKSVTAGKKRDMCRFYNVSNWMRALTMIVMGTGIGTKLALSERVGNYLLLGAVFMIVVYSLYAKKDFKRLREILQKS